MFHPGRIGAAVSNLVLDARRYRRDVPGLSRRMIRYLGSSDGINPTSTASADQKKDDFSGAFLTNLNRLKVSLTKFGAHKLAPLLKKYGSTEILNHLQDGLNVERVQAYSTLSASASGMVPTLWDDVRILGDKAIDGLMLIAIISSHHLLIEAFKQGALPPRYKGRLVRNAVLKDKTFTNFKRELLNLGYGSNGTSQAIDYDLSGLFKISGLNTLTAKLLTLRLETAEWDKSNSLEDELISLEFHKAFSIDEASFRAWLATGSSIPPKSMTEGDADFFEASDEKLPGSSFHFSAGHRPKKTGKIAVTAPTTDAEASLLHNAMQTKLYDDLVIAHGKNCVGTELNSGSGTEIDVVVETDKFRWFYEIKTADSVKACIRQAIPQLLEYAYWQCDAKRADKLIVVGPKPPTKDGEQYLKFLRDSFQLELYYEQCKV